jgi:two-component system chemotaxis response regulator CheY
MTMKENMAPNVLIVDDSPPMRSVIKKTIKISGFKVDQFFEAPDGRAALEKIEKELIDLVLTGFHMPEMDGLELLEEMNKNDTIKTIPVVVVTAEGSRQRREDFIEKGAIDYIRKPFVPEEIREKLKAILGEPEYEEGSPDSGDEGLDF